MARLELRGARAIVTGASSGIGRALVEQLAQKGVSVVMVARRAERLDQLAEKLKTLSANLRPVVGDITDESIRAQAIALAHSKLGGLDLLINNAGVSVQGEFADGTPEQLRQVFEVNFFAPIELARSALPLLRKSSRATIVNIASILGHRAIPFNSEYCATKFALRGWSEAVRAELAKENIHVLVVSPGTTKTEFFDSMIEKRRKMPWTEAHAQSPEAVARATLSAIERRINHTVPNWRGRMLLFANRVSPRFVDVIMRNLGSK